MKRILAWAVVAVLGACGGGGGGGGGNAAVDRTFTYGSSASVSSTQASALQTQLSSVTAMQGSSWEPTEAAGFQSLNSALLGDSSVPSFGAGQRSAAAIVASGARDLGAQLGVARAALTSASFDNPSCLQETPTSVTLTACRFSGQDTSEGMSFTALVNGHFNVNAGRDAVDWDMTMTMTVTGQGASGGASLHYSGNLALTASTIKGTMLAEMSVNATGNGQTVAIGLSESLAIDLGYQSTPTLCATSGTLEAKRVWTQRPQGASATQLPDRAAKVTFTGCGSATIQLSTN